MHKKDDFPRNCKARRLQLGFSQAQVALCLGTTPQAVSSWERGLCRPKTALAASLADLFQVELQDLFPEMAPKPRVTLRYISEQPVFRAHGWDAGLDLRADEDATIDPSTFRNIHTGFRVDIPEGYVGLLFARSGNGLKGIGITHGVGVIDAGYHGEVSVCLANMGRDAWEVRKGDRIAQLVIMPIPGMELKELQQEEWDSLEPTERNECGHGSSGKE